MSSLDQRLEFYVANEFGINELDLLEMNTETLVAVIKKCVHKSYQDLKRKVPYRYSTNKLKELNKEERKEFNNIKREFTENVEQSIIDGLVSDGVLNCSELNPYDIIIKVKEIANNDNFSGLFKPETQFTFGLAQKWVNMTIKYLWILGVFDDEYEELIEVPIDSFVISKLNNIGIDISTAWSTWDCPEEYLQAQDTLKRILENQAKTRIAWENESWVNMRVAK